MRSSIVPKFRYFLSFVSFPGMWFLTLPRSESFRFLRLANNSQSFDPLQGATSTTRKFKNTTKSTAKVLSFVDSYSMIESIWPTGTLGIVCKR